MGLEEGRKRGIEEGREEGITLGNFETLAGLVEEGFLSLEQAKERVKGKKEEFILWYEEQKKQK